MTDEIPGVLRINDDVRIPVSELRFKSSRSGGPGGQNVNKVETKVEVLFDIQASISLSHEVRQMLAVRLAGRLEADGTLRVSSQKSRSQWRNKVDALAKLAALLRHALAPVKKRVKTGPSIAARARRLHVKRLRGAKKQMRHRPGGSDE